MKISCESCGAKYTIADAKVQGRKVKVRCKSCKATILVDGNSGGDGTDEASPSDPPPAPAAIAVAPAAGGTPATTPKPGSVRKDAWSVNLSDDDSRDMTTAELIAGWKSGLVTQDAYAWKDGMSDWTPVLEIPELKQKLLTAKPLRADPVVSSAKLPPSPARPGAASDDLFGGVGLAGSEAEAMASPARPAPKASPGTGARNESSVLFSLDSLTGGGAPVAPTASADIFGGLGGGGLLATNTDLLTAPAKEPPPAPVFKPASIRPVLAAVQRKSSMPVVLAIIGAAVVVGGVLFFVMGGKDETPAVDPAAASMAAELEKTKAALEQSKAGEGAAKKKAEEAAQLAEAEAAKRKADEAAGKKPEEKPTETAAASPGTPSAPSSPGTSTPAAPATTKPAAPSGGGAFDVGAAKAALAAAAANAAGCGSASGPKGSGKVQVTFAPSGRVTSANVVSGPFGGTSVGGCVASKFRSARVPAFSGAPQTVAKGFSVN